MAKAVVHTSVTRDPFGAKVSRIGHTPAKKREIVSVLNQLERVSPDEGKPTSGMEEGQTYFRNGLRVFIWESYEAAIDSTRVGWDSGKVVLVESGRVVYYGPEIRRTEFFYDRLYHWALILKARADNRPTCRCCGNLMSIMYTENRQHYWYCKGFYLDETHPWVSERWDVGLEKALPPETFKFLKDKRERIRKYNRFRQKLGLEKHGTARDKKRSWKKV